MTRALKVIGWLMVVLLVLAAGAGVALWLGGGPALAWVAQHPIASLVGRDIRIGGPVKVRWGAPTRIVADDIHVANASWGSEPDMFSAKHLEVEIFARTLVRGPTRVPLVALDGARLLLETSKDGKRNWDFGLSSTAPKKRHQFPDLRRFTVGDSTLVFRNGETGAQTQLALKTLDFREHDPRSPVAIAMQGTLQGAPLRLKAGAGPIAQLRNPQQPYPVKFDGTLDQLHLVIDGTVAEPLDFAGIDARLSLGGAKFAEAASLLGLPLPALPDIRGTAKFSGGNGHWALDAVSLRTGQSDLEGGIHVDTTGKVPALQANFTSSFVDMADFKGLYGGKPARSSAAQKPRDPSGRVLPTTRIAVEKLPGINATLAFDAARIKSSGGLPLERVTLGVALKDGVLDIKPLRLRTADGDVDLDVHFTPFTTEGPPRLQANLDIRHIDLHKLLSAPSMPAILRPTEGIVGGFAKVESTGVTLRDFLGRMDGDAGIFLQNGRLSELLEQLAPINVLGALGVYVSGDRPVEINCSVSRFAIKQGVATASTLLVDTKDDTVVGQGNINFADETLDLKFTPYNKSLTVVTLRSPVDIRGTFADRTYHVEVGGLIARLGAAVGLGVLFPPAALLPLIDVGLGEKNACSKAYAAQQPPGNPEPKTGSTTPKH